MTVGAASWSFTEDDVGAIGRALQRCVDDCNARSGLLVERSGQLVTSVGDPLRFDPAAFAVLTAADFSANDELARLMGETEFTSLVHQGERDSMYLVDIGRRVILVILYDSRTTLGLVRLGARRSVDQLTALVAQLFGRSQDSAGRPPAILRGADDDIDKLFQ
jgi:predicted regulator of Ras-like GTPase activity (Roadblock/LC7/MglB family)